MKRNEYNEYNVSGAFLRSCIRQFQQVSERHQLAQKQLQVEHLQKTANKYFNLFNEDKLVIAWGDVETFAQYINTFGWDEKEALLEKLQQKTHQDVHKYLNKPEISLWKERLLGYKHEAGQFVAKWKHKIKNVFLGALVVVGGISLLKGGDKASSVLIKNKPHMTMHQKTNVNQFETVNQPIVVSFQQNTTPHEPKALTNFYNYRLKQFFGTKKRDSMLKKMEQQVENKRIVLPNDISAAHYLYAAEIYQRYNFKSIAAEMMKVQNMTDVLPDSVQQKLFGYVRQAGVKGVGVQQMSLGKQTLLHQLSR